MREIEQSIREWFRTMERCFRDMDYASARKRIAEDVLAFSPGTDVDVRNRLPSERALDTRLAESSQGYRQLCSTPLRRLRRSGVGSGHVGLHEFRPDGTVVRFPRERLLIWLERQGAAGGATLNAGTAQIAGRVAQPATSRQRIPDAPSVAHGCALPERVAAFLTNHTRRANEQDVEPFSLVNSRHP